MFEDLTIENAKPDNEHQTYHLAAVSTFILAELEVVIDKACLDCWSISIWICLFLAFVLGYTSVKFTRNIHLCFSLLLGAGFLVLIAYRLIAYLS